MADMPAYSRQTYLWQTGILSPAKGVTMSNITISAKELDAALHALNRRGPVLSAHKKGGSIILYFCGNSEPVRWKPPPKAKKTTTTPRKATAHKAATTP